MNVKLEDMISGTLQGKYLRAQNAVEVRMPKRTVKIVPDSGYFDLVEEIGTWAQTQVEKMALGHTDQMSKNQSVLAIAKAPNVKIYYLVEHD